LHDRFFKRGESYVRENVYGSKKKKKSKAGGAASSITENQNQSHNTKKEAHRAEYRTLGNKYVCAADRFQGLSCGIEKILRG
jgi:hypothetical protein